MPTFQSDGLELAYRDEGEGDPILLIHGFASSLDVNWVGPGWFETLKRDRRRVIAIDNRGHGASEKLYDPAFYGADVMAQDALALLDHLKIERADVMGYSMGARITALTAIQHPERVRSAILGGMGEGLLRGAPSADAIAEGLVAHSEDDIVDPMAKMFRRFAEATKSDRRALSACMRAQRSLVDAAMLGTIKVPVLVAVGTEDDVAGDLDALVRLIPGAEALPIPRRDHNRAVGDKVYKEGVLAFLARRP
ncbi:alpha/beta fold hydrolase [Hansschlegelia beijingensis]|uniref:Pimeloyl-ACP methyl ester carboxylesterase n=1 Tax=Hansschlegelia beijingensis TaxID=1133344 RepID=A0A7W6D0L5_9HYPH|nr:alpha/beta fold hydrolase [Hansschlegelia beijingensis]MBB3972446.1 pimeloyl-ACP methyl ester carboxylesterase [Hansschlegelia beijingensis]